MHRILPTRQCIELRSGSTKLCHSFASGILPFASILATHSTVQTAFRPPLLPMLPQRINRRQSQSSGQDKFLTFGKACWSIPPPFGPLDRLKVAQYCLIQNLAFAQFKCADLPACELRPWGKGSRRIARRRLNHSCHSPRGIARWLEPASQP